jgi:hypothetical protein
LASGCSSSGLLPTGKKVRGQERLTELVIGNLPVLSFRSTSSNIQHL